MRFHNKLDPIAIAISAALAASTVLASSPGMAQGNAGLTESLQRFDVPAGPLGRGLNRLAAQAGLALTYDPALASGKTTGGLQGTFTAEQALRRLLAGTGLSYRFADGNTVTLVAQSGDGPMQLGPIRVEGRADYERDEGFKAEYQESATKSPLPIRETPQSVSVITRDSIEARQARDVSSAIELSAGVTNARAADGGPFAGRGLGGGEGFILRGQELDGKRDVRMDGFVVSSNTFDLAPFERVEVIKGPASSLYGQGSLGGFINLVRKKPQLERQARIVGQAGSFETYRGEVDVTGSLDDEGRVLGRLVAAYDDSEAFIDHVQTRTAVIAPSLDFRVTESTRALFEVLYQTDDYTPSRGIPLRLDGNRETIPDVRRSLFAGVPSQEESSAENYLATLQLEHALNDRWMASLFLQKSGQKRERFFDSYANQGALDSSGVVYVYSDTSITDDDNWAGELRLNGQFNLLGQDHQLVTGAEFGRRKTDLAFGYTGLGFGNLYTGDFAADAVLPGGAGNQAYDFDISTRNKDASVYAQVVLSLSDRTKLLLVGRYDVSDIVRRDNISGGIDEKSDEAFTFRVGATQTLTPNLTAYGTYAQSFNPAVDARSESGAILDPERGEGFELGLKSEWFGGALGANVAVYRQELDDIPITDPNNRNFSINGGLQRTDGLEVEVSGNPYPGLTVGAALTWLESEFIERDDPNFGLAPGGFTDRQSAFFASYEFQRGSLNGLGVGASLLSVGERATFDGRSLDGYERVDVNLYYTGFKSWNLSLVIRNVLDERYIERYRDRYQDNFFGSPRAALLRAEYTF